MKTLVALVCCLALSAQAETYSAKVIVVMDGDTVMVVRDGKKIKVRLANIDAPEKAQPFGKQARDSLQELVGKKQIQIDSRAVDQYGRTVGLISVGELNVNQEQVRRGMAWDYSHFHNDKNYVGLESDARRARRGLWVQSDPQAPWQWRKLHPSAKTVTPGGLRSARSLAIPVMLYDMECGKKNRCAQMTSCNEANFYFIHCGVTALDGNHDGIPCQDLCAKLN